MHTDKLSKLKQNCHETFNEIFYEYYKQVYAYAKNATSSDYYAQEVVQLTFIKLWKYRHSISESIPLHVQVFRIAKTSLIDLIRQAEKNEKNMQKREQLQESADARAVDTYLQIHHKETSSKLVRIIASLPPVRKRVFEMSRFQEMSYQEISQVLNISTKTVENHIHLALKYIKTFFGE
ncbi:MULTISPECIES: sigma-70 family RNA polymerase sigma factor [Chitinophagaceae]